jgi:HEAT repeat protein
VLKDQFLNKLNEDVFHQVEKVRILALSTIPQLDGQSFDDYEDYNMLLETIHKATKSHSQDVRFLARKAANHLENITPGESSSPQPAIVSQEEQAQARRPAPVHVALANSQAFRLIDTVEENYPADDMQQSEEDIKLPKRAELISSISETSDPNELCLLIARLSECAITEDIRLIAKFLKHKDSRVRSNTIEFLSKHAPNQIQLKLITPLMEDPDNRVKGNVAKALADLGESSVIDYVSSLLDDPQMANRESAVYALSSFPDGDQVKELLYRALNDSYDGVKLRAIRALAAV